MIRIHGNVSGTPTDAPLLVVDSGAKAVGDLHTSGRVTFHLPDGTPPHGATVSWNNTSARFVIAHRYGEPLPPGDYEGSSLVQPLPTLTYTSHPILNPLIVAGERFIDVDGQRWWWKGATDMLLAARLEVGEDILPILRQRRDAGATIIRALAMGFPFWPSGAPARWDTVRHLFGLCADEGLYLEWVIFAGTRVNMPSLSQQQSFYAETLSLARLYPHVLIELLNEDGHGSQQIDPHAFSRPTGILASHGSGITDASPVLPVWDFATYHPRRDRPPDARGFTNYDPYEFQADWPKPCPFIADEGIKPHEYSFDPAWARQMGRHASMGAGATFHSDHGVRSELWTSEEFRCANAFYAAIY